MSLSTSLEPLPEKNFGFDQARHLLNRAGFGGSAEQIKSLEEMGLRKAVDYLVDYDKIDIADLPQAEVDPDIIQPPTRDQRRQMRQARRDDNEQARRNIRMERQRRQQTDRQQMESLTRWWLERMIMTPRPLEEKLVLLWHCHFATSNRTVRDSYLMYRQNTLFRKYARDSFTKLANGIIHDPAMIRFLDNHNNRKRKPNENLARELMELFTLGEGNYKEQDIKQGAAALTGYTFHDNEFFFDQNQHDDGTKSILGHKGRFDGDDFVRLLLGRKACAEFVSYKLYKHFVADLDLKTGPGAQSVIKRMARYLRAKRYNLAPVLKKLFKSRHFYDPHVMGNKIKSPVQLVVGSIRALQTPPRDLALLVDAVGTMGQQLFAPPSVAGWPGGRSWINTSTLFIRQNANTYLLTGKLPSHGRWERSQIEYDPIILVKDHIASGPDQVLDHLMAVLLGPNIHSQRREPVLSILNDGGGPITRDRLIGALLLITSMPEYQLC